MKTITKAAGLYVNQLNICGHVRTNGHVEEPPGPNDGEQAVNVVKDDQEYLALRGGSWLQICGRKSWWHSCACQWWGHGHAPGIYGLGACCMVRRCRGGHTPECAVGVYEG